MSSSTIDMHVLKPSDSILFRPLYLLHNSKPIDTVHSTESLSTMGGLGGKHSRNHFTYRSGALVTRKGVLREIN